MSTIDLRTAAQQALEALELGYDSAKSEADQYHAAMAGYKPERHAQMDAEVRQIATAITALKAALAEPVQEPVAWRQPNWSRRDGDYLYYDADDPPLINAQPLYTAPPQRKPLTLMDLQEALVYTNIIDRDAIDDPDNYDEGSTLEQIDELYRIIGGQNEVA